jgi:hypothetical protein
MDSEKIRAKFKHHLDARLKDEAMTINNAQFYWLTYLCETQTEIAAQLADLNETLRSEKIHFNITTKAQK